MTILVTGAKGNVGHKLCSFLQANGRTFVTASSRRGEADRYLNFLDADTFREALSGIDTLFLVRPPQLSKPQKDMLPFLTECKVANIKQIVFLSLQGVEHNNVTPHAKIENIIRQLGIGFTFLRPSFFMQNLTLQHGAEIREKSMLMMPAGDGKTNFIDAQDIAEAGAVVLGNELYLNKAFELTGARSYHYDEIAELLTKVLQRPIVYRRPSAIRFIFYHLRRRQPLPYVLVMTAIYTIARLGKADGYSADLVGLIGREPSTLEHFISQNRDCWLPC